MKILFVNALSDKDFGGGAEEIVWEQMIGLRDKGHECILLSTSNNSGLTKTIKDGITIWNAGIRNIYWPYSLQKKPRQSLRVIWHAIDSYNFLMKHYIETVVKETLPDLASLHNLTGWSVAAWSVLAKLKIPMVQVLHDYYAICAKSNMFSSNNTCDKQCLKCKIFRIPHRKISQKIDVVVGVSQFIIDLHLTNGYFSGVSEIKVIHNARSAMRMGRANCAKFIKHEGVKFGYIGRLDYIKGIEILIDAFHSAGIPNSELLIAGSGTKEYEHHLKRTNYDENIHFMGYVNPKDFYSEVDVVVIPSLWNENYPTVAIEALAFGKPLIGSKRGGIPELITEGVNGFLFDPMKPDELISCLRKFVCSKAPINMHPIPIEVINSSFRSWIDEYEDLYYSLASCKLVNPPASTALPG